MINISHQRRIRTLGFSTISNSGARSGGMCPCSRTALVRWTCWKISSSLGLGDGSLPGAHRGAITRSVSDTSVVFYVQGRKPRSVLPQNVVDLQNFRANREQKAPLNWYHFHKPLPFSPAWRGCVRPSTFEHVPSTEWWLSSLLSHHIPMMILVFHRSHKYLR